MAMHSGEARGAPIDGPWGGGGPKKGTRPLEPRAVSRRVCQGSPQAAVFIGLVPRAPMAPFGGDTVTRRLVRGCPPMAPLNLGFILVSFTGRFADNLE